MKLIAVMMAVLCLGRENLAGFYLLLALTTITLSVAMPLSTVDNPCNWISTDKLELAPFKTELHLTLIQLDYWDISLSQALLTFDKEDLLTKQERSLLLHEFNIPGLPTYSKKTRKLKKDDNMVTSMEDDQKDLQTFILFLKFLHDQEQDPSTSLKAKLLIAEYYGLSCLCRLASLLKLSQSPLSGVVTSSGVPDDVRQYVTSEDESGWKVAYVTLTEAKKRVQQLRKEYSALEKTSPIYPPAPIVNPSLPFVREIPMGMSPGKAIYVLGVSDADATRFSVNIVCGPNYDENDIAFHFNVRFNTNAVVLNNKIQGVWIKEERPTNFPFTPNVLYEIKIFCGPSSFKIAVNNEDFAEFSHRILPLQNLTHLIVQGDTRVRLIQFE